MPMNLARDQIIVERRYIAVFATISDQSLGALAQALPEALRDPFARAVGLRRGAFDEANTLATNVRTGMVARKAIIDAGVLLSEPCTEYFVDTLGDAFGGLRQCQIALEALADQAREHGAEFARDAEDDNVRDELLSVEARAADRDVERE